MRDTNPVSPKGTGRKLRETAVLATLLTLIGMTLAACGSSSDESRQDEIKTGVAKCDYAQMSKSVTAWGQAEKQRASLSDQSGTWRCADGWAVVFPEVGRPDEQVTVTLVFEAEGQFWVPKDRAKVCGETAAKSEVPESLFRAACQTN